MAKPRGRPPKPVAIHRLQGTYQRVRHDRRAQEPAAPGELSECAPPAWLSDNQRRRLWGELLADAPKGLLRRADQRLFAQYVVLIDYFERAVIAQNALDAESRVPLLMRGQQSVAISSYVRLVSGLVPLLDSLQSELGFTPTARARFGVPAAPIEPLEPPSEAWAELRRFPVISGGRKA
jgi:phage terminase small subunit